MVVASELAGVEAALLVTVDFWVEVAVLAQAIALWHVWFLAAVMAAMLVAVKVEVVVVGLIGVVGAAI